MNVFTVEYTNFTMTNSIFDLISYPDTDSKIMSNIFFLTDVAFYGINNTFNRIGLANVFTVENMTELYIKNSSFLNSSYYTSISYHDPDFSFKKHPIKVVDSLFQNLALYRTVFYISTPNPLISNIRL